MGGFDFESGAKQQEHDPELSQDSEYGVGGEPVEELGTQEDACQDLTNDAGKPETFEDFGEEFGSAEDQEDGERDGDRVVGGRNRHRSIVPQGRARLIRIGEWQRRKRLRHLIR